MNKMKIISCVLLILVSLNIFAQSRTLDEAIRTTATELGQRLKGGINLSDVYITPDVSIEVTANELRQQLNRNFQISISIFSSNWQQLSIYVIDELTNAIVRESSLTVVNRQQLDIVRREQNFQMSGEVSDESAQKIGKLLAAQAVLTGSFIEIGNTYRFRIRVIAVETGVELYSNSINIKRDPVLTALIQRPKPAPRVSAPNRTPREPRPAREPVEINPLLYFNFPNLSLGNNLGFGFQVGLSAGFALDSFNFLLDLNGGFGIGTNFYGSYNAGGLIEYRFPRTFSLGLGGGIGGNSPNKTKEDDFYPYIRSLFSIFFDKNNKRDNIEFVLYFDYNFDYENKFGILMRVNLLNFFS